MNKRLKILIATLISGVTIVGGAVSVAHAASSVNNGDVGPSGIPRSVFKQESLDATAQVLNTSTTKIQAARQDHSLKQLIDQAGLNRVSFDSKFKAELTTDLESKGYSKNQVSTALLQRRVHYLRHRIRVLEKK